jgi:hypothetical protein
MPAGKERPHRMRMRMRRRRKVSRLFCHMRRWHAGREDR